MEAASAISVQPSVPVAPAKPDRLPSIDILRGLIMAVMALDHTRDYFTNVTINSMDPDKSNVALFLTRLATHYCAPAFFLLAGIGAYLSGTRGKSKADLSRFLFTRGLFLLVLDLVVIRIGWNFHFDLAGGPWFIVLSALGISMMILAGLIYLPLPVVGAFGVLLIAGHNYFDRLDDKVTGRWEPLWVFLHVRESAEVAGVPFYQSYPLVPWVGVMAVAYAFGPVMLLDKRRRRWALVLSGLALIVLFVVLRGFQLYGDPRPWVPRYSTLWNVLSFLRTKKYPPSLQYLLMTLGPCLIALAAFDGARGPIAYRISAFGRVPLFFYVAHLYVIHGLALAVGVWRGFAASEFCVPYNHLPVGWGFGLAGVYLAWLTVLVLLYPVCAWFSDLKRRSKAAWLSYL